MEIRDEDEREKTNVSAVVHLIGYRKTFTTVLTCKHVLTNLEVKLAGCRDNMQNSPRYTYLFWSCSFSCRQMKIPHQSVGNF